MRLRRTALTALLSFALIVPAAMPAAAEGADLDSDLNLGNGTTIHTNQYLLQEDAKDKCLAAIKEVRQEALDSNVPLHVKGGTQPLKEYLAEKGMSTDAYLNPKWSTALEQIAVVRAAESAVHGKVARERLNKGQWDSLTATPEKYRADIEALAWPNAETCQSAVDRWASKKKNYVKKSGSYLDYAFLINPNTQAYGIAGVKKTEKSNLKYTSVWAGEGANKPSGPEAALNQSGFTDIPLNVTDDAATAAAGKAKFNKTEIKVGEEFTPEFTGTIEPYNAEVSFSGTFFSGDDEIATLTEDGKIVGVHEGTVQINLMMRNGTMLSETVYVVPAQIVKVADLDAVTTESGTAPVLPETVKVDWDNGKTDVDAKITWEKIDPKSYSAREGGKFTVTGHIDGWDKDITVDVTVNSAGIVGIDAPLEVSTVVGTPAELPKTVKIIWSNGDITDEPVTWSKIDDDAYKTAGTIRALGELTNYPGATVDLDVKVTSKETPKAPEVKKNKEELPKTGVELPLLAGAFVLLLAAGISLRKYASFKK